MDNDEFNEKLINSLAKLQQYTHLFTTNSDEADDLFQETLLKALCNHGYYRSDKNFNGWIYTIMHHTFLNNSRTAKYYADIDIEHCEHLFERICIDCNYNYSELLSLVESLPEINRMPLKMYVDGYKYHEIAEKLGLSIGTVKSRIHIARTRLKEKLQRENWT